MLTILSAVWTVEIEEGIFRRVLAFHIRTPLIRSVRNY